MNINALFDKLLVDLADAGVTEGPVEGGCRFLVHDGVPFARLADERMAFRTPPGTGVHEEAASLETSRELASGQWVEVPAQDVSEWELLARRALATMRGRG